MFKKELAPGIIVYRPDFNIDDSLLDNISNPKNLIPDFYVKYWHNWGEIDGFKKAHLDLQKIQENLDKYSELDNINFYINFYEIYRHLSSLYLNDTKSLNILKPYINYDIESKEWLFGECMIQLHKGQPKNIDGKMGLGFHLDIADSNVNDGVKHIFTGNLYLNDEYESGEIIFIFPSDLNNVDDYQNFKSITYKPKRGDFIFYPADWPVVHGVNFAFNADRYLIVSTTKWQYDGSMGESLKDYMLKDQSLLKHIDKMVKEENKQYIDGRSL